jgi:hypothetical protein
VLVALSCNSLLYCKFVPVLTELTFDPSYSYATSLPSAAGLDLAPACEGWSCDGSDCKRSEVMLPAGLQ